MVGVEPTEFVQGTSMRSIEATGNRSARAGPSRCRSTGRLMSHLNPDARVSLGPPLAIDEA